MLDLRYSEANLNHRNGVRTITWVARKRRSWILQMIQVILSELLTTVIESDRAGGRKDGGR